MVADVRMHLNVRTHAIRTICLDGTKHVVSSTTAESCAGRSCRFPSSFPLLTLRQVVVGLGMSILLLLLSGALIRFAEAGKTHACHAVFDSTGVLQLAWLFGDEPDLLRIRRPEVEALRGAGMFEVELTKRAHEKVKWAFESESSVALTGSATNLIAKEKAPQYATVRLGLIPSVPLLYM